MLIKLYLLHLGHSTKSGFLWKTFVDRSNLQNLRVIRRDTER